jgi:hypothetical protein
MDIVSIIISSTALTISALTFWLTKIKNGIVKMTRPTVIFFGPDGNSDRHKKVYIKTLLYSTSDRGQYIQNMFIRLQRGESVQNFNIWVYGDKGLERGSGLFISKNGIACNHHFLLPIDGENYSFVQGDYNMQVFIEQVDGNTKKLFEQELKLTNDQTKEMRTHNAGIYFDWAPNSKTYFPHIDSKLKEKKEISNLNNRE